MSLTLSDNLKLGNIAVKYTNTMLSHGAGNKWADLITSGGMNVPRVSTIRGEQKRFSGMGGLPENSKTELQLLPKIRWIAHLAKKHKVGNCGECASVAFMFLLEIHRAKRLDYMHFAKPGDHAWVVIGRAQNSKTNDFKTWGSAAVVCDPWANIAFPGYELPSKLHSYGSAEYHSILVTG